MSKDTKSTKPVVTTLTMDSEKKSCVLFRSKNKEEKVTTSLYLLNQSYEALGSPSSLEVTVAKKA